MKKHFYYLSLAVSFLFTIILLSSCKKSEVNLSPPSITNIKPESGPANTTVTIFGTNFSTIPANNTVTFNHRQATILSANTTQLTVTVPVGAGTGDVDVTVGNQTASGPSFIYQTVYTVSTIAGSGAAGSADGAGSQATFNQPTGVAVDLQGNVYVADRGNNLIRKITTDGVVTTFAGSGASGSKDSTSVHATFNSPMGVAVDRSGNLFITDQGNNLIREITSSGLVTTLAGSGIANNTDGTGAQATFNGPTGILIDPYGDLYIADSNNNSIREIFTGAVTTLIKSGLSSPYGLALNSQGNLFVANSGLNKISQLNILNVALSTFVGSGSSGSNDGFGASASFSSPFGLTIDAQGNIYVSDNSCLVRMISPVGEVSTIAGSLGSADGVGTAAGFNGISFMAMDASGNIYLADTHNNKIRKITII